MFSSAAAARERTGREERMPLLVALFATIALLSLAQGLAEFTLPLLAGEAPFALSRGAALVAGVPGIAAAILLHNLGLALLVPGCGLLAARAERDPAKRRLLGPILIAALVGAVLVGVVTVLSVAPSAHLGFLLPLAAAEAAVILLVAHAAHQQMRLLRGPVVAWGDVSRAARALQPTILFSAAALAALSFAEAWFLRDAWL